MGDGGEKDAVMKATSHPDLSLCIVAFAHGQSLYLYKYMYIYGFPGSSAGKESACRTGDPSLIPGLGRSPKEGIGHSPQYSWASLWLSW